MYFSLTFNTVEELPNPQNSLFHSNINHLKRIRCQNRTWTDVKGDFLDSHCHSELPKEHFDTALAGPFEPSPFEAYPESLLEASRTPNDGKLYQEGKTSISFCHLFAPCHSCALCCSSAPRYPSALHCPSALGNCSAHCHRIKIGSSFPKGLIAISLNRTGNPNLGPIVIVSPKREIEITHVKKSVS